MGTTTASENAASGATQVLAMSLELGASEWKMAFSPGLGQQPRHRTVAAGDREAVKKEIAAAKARFKLPADVRVASCYEAGRDGFWIHRALEMLGVENHVVDSAAIEVSRRSRRAKTDRLDAAKLLNQLLRYLSGEKRAFKVVRVPTEEEEDRRHLHRELKTVKGARPLHACCRHARVRVVRPAAAAFLAEARSGARVVVRGCPVDSDRSRGSISPCARGAVLTCAAARPSPPGGTEVRASRTLSFDAVAK